MSGDASKSKGQKKAGSAASSAAAKKNAANLKYASKKSKAEKKKEQNLQKMSKSRCCSWSTLFYLLILTGAGMAAVKQYPDKVQELYDNLPPQVSLKMILSLYWRVLIIKTENTTFNILTVLFQTFVYIILTDFNFTRKIVTFVYSILTDFNFTRKDYCLLTCNFL